MLSKAILKALPLTSGAIACPGHENHISEGLEKRVVVSGPAPPPTDWAYEASRGVWTVNPSATFDNTTVYLKGWHIHSPADHSVNGDRSKAELHLVHVDEEGREKAVMAIRLDPGNANKTFFDQLPPMIGLNQTGLQEAIEINIQPALDSVLRFNEFWTYRGSLTSPPCRKGINPVVRGTPGDVYGCRADEKHLGRKHVQRAGGTGGLATSHQ
ncbi:Alpha carbonic anhydrase 4 [Colletotrichum tanaceti]|uniref:Alpha carbonic anhydrase 4 n=1 Tax=Colletotrichum tanaceti TaxID=1306861 RepID=A0A4U6X9F4_9PEZI|nr:Alpha carbonic anhydrase 4 [Colletotrichum tanaceti]TKW51783.1 Alpha carbonic anhydrase 4 [Colletotrichum tanaceti]